MALRRYSGSFHAIIRNAYASNSSSRLLLASPFNNSSSNSTRRINADMFPLPKISFTPDNPRGLLKPVETLQLSASHSCGLRMPFCNAKLSMYRSLSSGRKERYKVHYSEASETAGQHQKSEAKVAPFLRSMQEKMKSEELPTAALGLGLAGAIPFILLTPAFSSLLPEVLSARPLEAQAAYGAVILSFLGGPHWGLAMVRTHAPPHDKVFNINISTARYIWSIVPSLLAWPALLLSDIPKMSLLILSFSLVLGVDAWCSMQGLLPPWYLPLRVLLSLVVIFCLISSTLNSYLSHKVKSGRETNKD